MGRKASGFRITWKRGWAYVRFSWEGVDVRAALDTQDKREAEKRAAHKYSDVVSGRVLVTKKAPGRATDLEGLLDQWVRSKVSSLDERTVPTIEGYCRTFLEAFRHLDAITEASASTFGLTRLRRAMRKTVLRELAYLRQFLDWAKLHGHLRTIPVVPKLPPKAQGTRTGKQRAKAIPLTRAEAMEIIAKLPVESKTIDGRKWPLRARYEFMVETGLRPETLSRLSVPGNWQRGAGHVELANEDDKARYGRVIDITPRAKAILTKVAPERGPIFGRHVYYKALKRAAAEVLDAARAKDFAPYDLRHLFVRELLDASKDMRGTAHQAGHKLLTTTNKYLAPDRTAGKRALGALVKRGRKG